MSLDELDSLLAKHQTLQGRFEERVTQVAELGTSLADTRTLLRRTELASKVIQHIAEKMAESSEQEITKLASLALKEVFSDQELSLKVEHDQRGGQPAVKLFIRDEATGVEAEPLDAFGGGPGSILALILRVITVMRHPQLSRILILDEPVVQVSGEYIQKTAELLRTLCEPPKEDGTGGLGFDMLVITHNSDLAKAAHKKYYAYRDQGKYLKLKLLDEDTSE